MAKGGLFRFLSEYVYESRPQLHKQLKLAEISEGPLDFIEKTIQRSLVVSVGVILAIYLLFLNDLLLAFSLGDYLKALLLIVPPILIVPIIVFNYFMLYPHALIMKRRRELDYEIVFAGRHILIALRAGMPLFDALVSASKGYGEVSREINKIVDKVVVGVPITQAIREVVQYNPSKYFTRVMMQITNALSSGADVSDALEAILEQIVKEQMIALKEYNQKLTPVVMFYMIFGIIVPSLGIVLGTIIFSAVSGGALGLPSEALWVVLVLIALVQFLFLGYVESSRPKYLL